MMAPLGDADASSERTPLLDSSGEAFPSHLTKANLSPNDNDHVATNDLERHRSHGSVDEARAAQFKGNEDVAKQLKFIIPAIAVGVFLSAADQFIIVSSYAKIGSDLEALNLTSWIATAYFLTLTSFQPLYGKLSDIFGRKTCLLFAYGIFGVGGLACGLAQDINQLIAARVVQGIGGGGMTTVVSILISDIVPLRDRGVYQGFINIIYATGAGAGAPIGGLLADRIGWRWSFLGQVPLCVAGFLALSILLKLPVRDDEKAWRAKLQRIDFLGAAVLVSAVFGMIFGLDRGSNLGSWSTPITYTPISASIVLFGIFIYVENNFAAEPFVPGHVVFDRFMIACYLCNFFSFGGWLALLFYLPLFFQAVDGVSATAASLRLIPSVLFGVSGSLAGGFIMRGTGKYYWLTVFAYCLLTLGSISFTLFTGILTNSTIGIVIGMCICAFGNGVGVTTTLIGIIANAAPEDQAVATACSYLFRSLGSVIGISLETTVVNQVLRTQLESRLGSGKEAEKIVEGVRRSLEYIKTLNPEVAVVVRECYGIATRDGFVLMVLIVLGSAISAFFIRETRLSR
jgi:predicted MFS family arabinose efflux permease